MRKRFGLDLSLGLAHDVATDGAAPRALRAQEDGHRSQLLQEASPAVHVALDRVDRGLAVQLCSGRGCRPTRAGAGWAMASLSSRSASLSPSLAPRASRMLTNLALAARLSPKLPVVYEAHDARQRAAEVAQRRQARAAAAGFGELALVELLQVRKLRLHVQVAVVLGRGSPGLLLLGAGRSGRLRHRVQRRRLLCRGRSCFFSAVFALFRRRTRLPAVAELRELPEDARRLVKLEPDLDRAPLAVLARQRVRGPTASRRRYRRRADWGSAPRRDSSPTASRCRRDTGSSCGCICEGQKRQISAPVLCTQQQQARCRHTGACVPVPLALDVARRHLEQAVGAEVGDDLLYYAARTADLVAVLAVQQVLERVQAVVGADARGSKVRSSSPSPSVDAGEDAEVASAGRDTVETSEQGHWMYVYGDRDDISAATSSGRYAVVMDNPARQVCLRCPAFTTCRTQGRSRAAESAAQKKNPSSIGANNYGVLRREPSQRQRGL